MQLTLAFDQDRFIGYQAAVQINVAPVVAASDLDPDDESFADGAVIGVDILSPVLDHAVLREIALDIFHETVPIASLEQFEIEPDLPEQGRLMLDALALWANHVGDVEGARCVANTDETALDDGQGRFLLALFERLREPFGLAVLIDEAKVSSYWYVNALCKAGIRTSWPR